MQSDETYLCAEYFNRLDADMEQAKLRGDYPQRKAEGTARREAEQAVREAEAAAREAAFTPEQRARRQQAQQLAGLLLAAARPETLATLRIARTLFP